MHDTLDEIAVKNNSNRYAKLSFLFGLLTICILSYLFVIIPATISAKSSLAPAAPPMILVSSSYFFCLIGVLMTILSIKERERNSWYKWIGGILNLTTFLLILIVILWTVLGSTT